MTNLDYSHDFMPVLHMQVPNAVWIVPGWSQVGPVGTEPRLQIQISLIQAFGFTTVESYKTMPLITVMCPLQQLA